MGQIASEIPSDAAFLSEAIAERLFRSCPRPSSTEEGAGEGSCPLTIELLPLLALGGLQLNLPPEVTHHLSVVGERRVDGELSFRGL